MKIVFMGTPEFAVPSLDALIGAGHRVIAVYTQPPRRAGRGKSVTPSPVHMRAGALGIDVMTPVSLRHTDEQARFAALDADIAVVAAYGLILPQPILDAPRLGCVNVHASLLPRWRGAAPIQRAILAGDAITGVTIMQMEAGLDTGPMLARVETAIGAKNAGTLTAELAKLGAASLVDVLADLPGHPPVAQPETGVLHAPKIDKAESRLDFLISAHQAARQVRAFAPTPGAWFEHEGERIRIVNAEPAISTQAAPPGTVIDDRLTIACNPGALTPTTIQRAGRGAMSTGELLRGFPDPKGHAAFVTRFRLTIEYDGRPFMGWQRQPHGPSVQQALEEAAFAITGEDATFSGAGRTDAGVHAEAMAAHVDLAKAMTPFRLMEALNAKLRPLPAAVLGCTVAPDNWHARFSCVGRRYIYRIVNRRAPLALDVGRAWRVPNPLDADAMQAAAQRLVGRHDFTTFRSVHCQSESAVKTLDKLDVRRFGEEIEIEAAARSFLHHQVRSMVGCLMMVGRGQWSAADLEAALDARDRAALGFNAPPDGLYFVEAVYAG